jgi:hypothetical protein
MEQRAESVPSGHWALEGSRRACQGLPELSVDSSSTIFLLHPMLGLTCLDSVPSGLTPTSLGGPQHDTIYLTC